MRITTVAPNARGELLLIDSEAHVIYIASRGVPCELKTLAGKAGTAGDADPHTVSGKVARLREPQFLAMLVVAAGKKEYAYFSDVGNGKIRLLSNVHTLVAKPSVTTVMVRSSVSLEPYALALVDAASDQLVLAVGEDRRRRVLLVRFDHKSRTTGAVIHGMEWPHLLTVGSLAALDSVLYAANRSTVLTINLRFGTQASPPIALREYPGDPPFAPFIDAQGLAVASADWDTGLHTVYVADASANQIRMLTVEGTFVRHVAIFGSGVAATLPGPVGWSILNGSVAFHEPVGLAVQHGVLFVACYGGTKQGSVVAVSPTDFAVQLLQVLGDLYDAFGFLLPSASPAQRAARHPPLQVALNTFGRCTAFLDQTCQARSEHLGGHKGLKGPDGSFYWHTVKGGLITLSSCCAIKRELEAAGVTNAEHMTLYALVDEGPVENGFGILVMQSITDMPTAKMFAEQLPEIQRHTLMKLGRTPWSQHTSIRSHYASAEVSPVSAPFMMACAERTFYAWYPQHMRTKRASSTAVDRERLQEEKECARRFARIAEAQRVGSVRSCFKGRVGFGPTILEAAIAPAEGADAAGRRFPSYRERLQALPGSTSADASHELLSRTMCSYLAGDIVFLLAGAEDAFWRDCREDIDGEVAGTVAQSGALWWPVQLTQSIRKSQSGQNCRVHGFWLEELLIDEETATEDRQFALLSGTEIAPLPRLCNLLKDPATGHPYVVASEALPSGWSSSEGQVYVISVEWAERLDAAAEVVHGAVDLSSSSSDSTSSDESDDSNESAGGKCEVRKGTYPQHEVRNSMRQQSLREAFGAPGLSAPEPISIAERLTRLQQIQATLGTYRRQWLQEQQDPLAMMSLANWPMSLRRQLKEAQRLSRELQAEGVQMMVGIDPSSL